VNRRFLIAGLVLAFAATGVVAANALRGPRDNGPIESRSRVNTSLALADDELLTWGMDLPLNPTQTDIKIRSLEPVGAIGVDVVGIAVDYPVLRDGVCWSTGVQRGSYPPPGIQTMEAKGAVLPAASTRTCGTHPEMLVGVRRSRDSGAGRIEAMRMVYDLGGNAYELVIPYSLDVRRPGPDAK
jgi:hypothetical protein